MNKEKYTRIIFSLSEKLRDEIKEFCGENDINLSLLIRELLKNYMKKEKRKTK